MGEPDGADGAISMDVSLDRRPVCPANVVYLGSTVDEHVRQRTLTAVRVSADSARGLLHAKVVGMGLKVDAREVVQPQLRLQEAAARGDQPSAISGRSPGASNLASELAAIDCFSAASLGV